MLADIVNAQNESKSKCQRAIESEEKDGQSVDYIYDKIRPFHCTTTENKEKRWPAEQQ